MSGVHVLVWVTTVAAGSLVSIRQGIERVIAAAEATMERYR